VSGTVVRVHGNEGADKAFEDEAPTVKPTVGDSRVRKVEWESRSHSPSDSVVPRRGESAKERYANESNRADYGCDLKSLGSVHEVSKYA
jgi:hypothetical protein